MSDTNLEKDAKTGEVLPSADKSPKDALKAGITNTPDKVRWEAQLQILDTKIQKLSDDKKKASSKEEKISLQKEINALRREKNRITWFNNISFRWTEKQKELAKWQDIDSISAKKLLQLEKEKPWFLAWTFAYVETVDSNWESKQEPLVYWKAKEWDKIIIDFWPNSSANKKVGAWDILTKDIKVVKITDANWAIRIWVRKILWNKVGYYDEKWYIPVFNGFTIEIPKKAEAEAEVRKVPDYKETTIEDEQKTKDKFIEEIEHADNFTPDWDYMWIYWKNVQWEVIKNLPKDKTVALLKKIFWEWTWTELLIALDDKNWTAIKRIIALGYHENKFKFWDRKGYAVVSRWWKIIKDYESEDIWTFQIHADTKKLTEDKYTNYFKEWLRIARSKWIWISNIDNNAQKDLIAHIWYIWEWKFKQLSNASMNDEQVIEMMTSMQWWVRDIWVSVIKQINEFRAIV